MSLGLGASPWFAAVHKRAGPAAMAVLLGATALPSFLSHSRAGGAMMFDGTGKLTWAPNNIFTNSDNFSVTGAGGWSPTNLAVSSGAADPAGSTGAYLLTNNGASGSHFISRVSSESVVGAHNMIWFTAKAGTANYVHVLHGGTNIYAQFSLADGSLVYSGGSTLVGYGSTSLGDGWFRFYIIVRTTSSSLFRIYPLTASSNVAGPSETSSATMSIYKARLSLVTYETTPRTVDDVSTTSAAYYGPVFEYDPSTLAALGLRLEGTRTNVALWNRDLTNAAWTATNITAAKDQTGIDGVASSASKITASAGNGTCLQAITLASSARFQSAYVKRVTGSGVIEMTMDNGTTWTAITVTADWTRVSIPTQTLANPTVGFRIVTSGDAIAVDFVQNENGAFASSPIWTTTAAVTRASDVCQIVGSALAAFSSNYGAVVAQIRITENPLASDTIISGSTASNRYIYSPASGPVSSYNGSVVLSSLITAYSAFKRVGFAWDKGTPKRRIHVTGGSLQSDANTPNIGATTQWLGSINGTSNFSFMRVQSLAFYNKNLSNAELASKLTVDGAY